MKKFFVTLLVLASISASAQRIKKDSLPPAPKAQVTDTTALFSFQDYQEMMKQPWFGEMPSRWADIVREYMYRRLMEKAKQKQ